MRLTSRYDTIDRNFVAGTADIQSVNLPNVVRVNQSFCRGIISSEVQEEYLPFFEDRALNQFAHGDKRIFTESGQVYSLRKIRRKDPRRILVYVRVGVDKRNI